MFTSDEVQAAINQFLATGFTMARTPVVRNRDVVGARNQIYDLLSTTLLLRPDSYFYLIWLAKNRLRGLVQSQIALMQDIEGWAPYVYRTSKRVESVTDLVNAEAAALNLNAGLNSRSTGVRGSIGPAVERFRASVERFITTELVKNVVSSGEVTETGEELRVAIAGAWEAAKAQDAEIVTRTAFLASALSSLSGVRLPESAVQGIVSRILAKIQELQETMAGDSAAAESRMAMLDLLTSRTLLSRASAFTNPALVLAPTGTDATTGTLIDAGGTEAAITGTVSGPFNYSDGAVFDLNVNGGALPSISLPGSSQATIRSTTLSFPSGPGAGAQFSIQIDHSGSFVSHTPSSSYASGAAAAADLSTVAGLDVTWDVAESQLVFRSSSNGDLSHLWIIETTAARQQVTDWLFGSPHASISLEAVGSPVAAQDAADTINGASGLVTATAAATQLANFVAERTDVGGEEDLLWDITDSGADLTADGTATVTGSKNFEALGITTDHGLVITAPTPGTYSILEVDGSSLTLDAAVAAATCTYYIGPDYRSLPVDARIRVVAPSYNAGYARVALGEIARVQADVDWRLAETGLLVSIFQEFLTITSRGTTTSSSIGVLSSSGGSTAFGFSVAAAETPASLDTLQASASFLERGIRAGDSLYLTSPGSTSYTAAVGAVTATRLTFSPPVPYEAGSWAYEVRSARYEAATPLLAAAGTYESTADDLDRTMGRLVSGARYAAVLSDPVTAYITELQTLLAACDAYVVSRDHGIDSIVQTMREQGFDRAADLLLKLDVDTFFTMPADGVSYSSYLARQAADTTREVAPIRKSARSDRVIQEFRPISFQRTQWDPRDVDET